MSFQEIRHFEQERTALDRYEGGAREAMAHCVAAKFFHGQLAIILRAGKTAGWRDGVMPWQAIMREHHLRMAIHILGMEEF